ncbi:MAG TPA: decaprenyl-phosphate phosphoribosyltransferase [Planctomycetota bacterium]|nr:decaprenyl-phosphate phosphoribosyltransferase [Planctomycetota bacterium]
MSTSAPAQAAEGAGRWLALLAAMRPHQWTKNLLVFAALLFARKFLEPEAVRFILLSVAGFAIFCAASSASYLLNDVLDAEADRQHPLKRLRPVASGALPTGRALGVGALLAAGAVAAGFALGVPFGAVVAAYLVLQVGYSLVLKHVVILDVLCIAASFVLRAGAGALVIGVALSHWLLICAALLALFLALAKRRHELVEVAEASSHRRSLADYTPQMLDQMIAVVTASTLMAYTLYTIDRETVAKFGTDNLKFTIPFVLYGVFRYLYLVYAQRGGGNPSRHLLTDKPLLLDVFLYALTSAWILWRWGGSGAP